MGQSEHVVKFLTPTKNVERYKVKTNQPTSKGPAVPRLLPPVTTTEMYGHGMVHIPEAKAHPPTIMPRVQQPAKTTTDVYVRRSSPEMYHCGVVGMPKALPTGLSIMPRLLQPAKTTTDVCIGHTYPEMHLRDMLHMPKAQALPLRRTLTM